MRTSVFDSSTANAEDLYPALVFNVMAMASSRLILRGCCAQAADEASVRITITNVAALLPRFRWKWAGLESKMEYSTGSTTSVKNVADTRPPMTTVAKGRCTSAPALVEIAIGKKPRAAAEAVSNTGRRRSRVPRRIRSVISVKPCCLSSLKCSINTMPFSTAIPNKAMKPTPAEMLKGISRSQSRRTPPTAANGMAL